MSGKPLFLLRRPLWLASSSRYRRELLARLGLPFEHRSPDIDESRLPGEAPDALARRLARAKAEAIAAVTPEAWVIGSDQVCALGAECLGKPGTLEGQLNMLSRLAGNTVSFYTAVSIVGPGGVRHEHLDETRCVFRALSTEDIETYVEAEPAIDCAGGFKSESLGMTLLERLETVDPTALIGLPMIWVAGTLRALDA